MNQRRAFVTINVVLTATCLALVYYLASSSSGPPPELAKAERMVALIPEPAESGGTPTEHRLNPIQFTTPKDYRFMNALYALSPTPTPTAKPTATPIPISGVTASWVITAMEETSVSITDQRTNEEFEMSLNGGGKAVEFQGQTLTIKLCAIDLESDPPQAKFCAGAQTVSKQF